ncbi:hypothetical protein HZH66_002233 [Vespula vulgaris]|uniref:Uncharacterized protein n=1 Tax=Vespula vulgaris TaxID=7454 RepID=A0A834KKS4_VESVU|nr:hypothetical protein HZH66_002233 [Vespula vulgaris]
MNFTKFQGDFERQQGFYCITELSVVNVEDSLKPRQLERLIAKKSRLEKSRRFPKISSCLLEREINKTAADNLVNPMSHVKVEFKLSRGN